MVLLGTAGFCTFRSAPVLSRAAPRADLNFLQHNRICCEAVAEIVDVVDDQDNVLYAVTKEEAHQKGLLHRTVISEVLDDRGRFLLVRQAPDRQDAGQYVSPVGGHVRSGESEEDALKREAFEETGLSEFKYKLVGKFVFDRFVRNKQENHYFIVYEIYSDSALKLNEEAVEYKAFTKEELRERLASSRKDFGGAYIAVIERFYPDLLGSHFE